MRTKSFLACAIDNALGGPTRIRPGPISPYLSQLNREAYYRLLGHGVWRARSVGKTPSINTLDLLPHQRIAYEAANIRN